MKTFLREYGRDVTGVLSGFDRLLFRGTIRMLSAPQGMQAYLSASHVLLTDFAAHVLKVSSTLKEAVIGAVASLNRPVIHLTSGHERKDQRAREIALRDGIRDGVVCLLTAVEPCSTFEVRGNRETKRIEVRRGFRKCLFLYRYEFHPVLGFIHTRLQSWFPFSAQVWVNGREWLARQMTAAGLDYQRRENCFTWLQDSAAAQRLMNEQLRTRWPHLLDSVLLRANPITRTMLGRPEGLRFPYYWSVAQCEWATDVMFRNPAALARLYPHLVRHAMSTFGSRDVLRFLGRKLPVEGPADPTFKGEVVSDLKHRPEGICVKHRVNRNGLKLYDKQGSVLRIETTINQPYEFKVYRRKEGDSHGHRAWQPLRHGIADVHRRAQISQAVNDRYAEALATAACDEPFGNIVGKLAQPTMLSGRRVRALRPWAADDLHLLRLVGRGDHLLNGLRNRDLVAELFPNPTDDPAERRRRSARASRLLRLLRAHSILRKVPKTHRYQVTTLGRRAITAILAAHNATTNKLVQLTA